MESQTTLAKIFIVIDMSLMSTIMVSIGTIGRFFYSIEATRATLILIGPFSIYCACLTTEFIGIHKKIQGLIIFNCVIRVFLSILNGIALISILIWIVKAHQARGPKADMMEHQFSIIFLVISILLLAFFLFRTVMLFKAWIQSYFLPADQILYNTNGFELGPLPPAYKNII